MLKNILFVAAILFLPLQTQILAQRHIVKEKVAVSAGNVEFVQVQNSGENYPPHKWQIKLKNKVLHQADQSYGGLFFEKIFKSFGGREDVVVFNESPGGTMFGEGFYGVLAIRSNAAHYVSKTVGNGTLPQISQTGDKIVIDFPRVKADRTQAAQPAETWIYQHGKLTQQKSVKRGR